MIKDEKEYLTKCKQVSNFVKICNIKIIYLAKYFQAKSLKFLTCVTVEENFNFIKNCRFTL